MGLLDALRARDLTSNEQDNGSTNSGADGAIVLIVFSTVFLVARIWSRLTATRDMLWWDDWLAILAWPMGIYFCLVVMFEFLGLTRQPSIANTAFAADAMYYTGIIVLKLSALAFYARVFRVVRSFRRQLWIVGALNIIVGTPFVFATTFYCIPARKVWEPQVPGSCANLSVVYLVATSCHLVLDVVVLLLPMPQLYSLQLNRRKKIALVIMFLLGYAVPLFSVIKIGYVAKLLEDEGAFITPLALTMCEIPVGIVSLALPSAFELFRHVARFGPTSLVRSRTSSERRARLRSSSARLGGTEWYNPSRRGQHLSAPRDGSSTPRKISTTELRTLSHDRNLPQSSSAIIGHQSTPDEFVNRGAMEIHMQRDVSVQEMI